MNSLLSGLRGQFRPHREIHDDLSESRQFDPLYLLMLVLSCLIALLGLLLNSPAVIIGAMLISPLMGPILACGLALTLADWVLGKKALRNVALSVAEAVGIAALATLLSPLRDPTAEVLARTHPNLMDLLIAFFSGVAGTLALASRKGGMTILPGVAIATAVMPPLAVTGYGIATGQWGIAGGGFMLFFTNLTAILISAAAVFLLVGFRPHEEADHLLVRHRIMVAAAVLIVVSIPLVRTLRAATQQALLRREITSVLKRRLEASGEARLSGVDFKAGPLQVAVVAVVYTSRFIPRSEEDVVASLLSERLGRPVQLDLQQLRLETQDFLAAMQSKPAPAPTPRAPAVAVVGDVQERLQSSLRSLLEPAGVESPVVRSLGRQAEGALLVEVVARAKAPSDASAWSVAATVLKSEAGSPVQIRATVEVGDPILVRFRPGAGQASAAETAKLASLVGLAKQRPGLELAFAARPGMALGGRRLSWLKSRLAAPVSERLESVPDLDPEVFRAQLTQEIAVPPPAPAPGP